MYVRFTEVCLYHYEPDEAVKASRKDPLFKETLPFNLGRLEAIAKENHGHLALCRVSYCKFLYVIIIIM